MKSSNPALAPADSVYTAVALLALVFWNPLSFWLVYGDTSVYSSRFLQLLFWLAFATGVICVILIQIGKIGDRTKNIVLSFAWTGVLFALLVGVDGVVGLFTSNERNYSTVQNGLVYDTQSRALYRMEEFDFVIETNELGLRGPEITVDKGDKFRIMAVGDSWTVGWGVDVEDSYPNRLQRFLAMEGYNNIDVVTVAQGGRYTGDYRAWMEEAVPLLQPDLILIGVLQVDDLAQSYEKEFVRMSRTGLWSKIIDVTQRIGNTLLKFLKISFENFIPMPQSSDVRSEWQKSAVAIIDDLDQLQAVRFSTLDEEVQQMYRSGNINPYLLQNYLDFPDRVTVFADPDRAATAAAVRLMNADIARMQEIAESNNARAVFVNLPINAMTGHAAGRSPDDALNDYYKDNNRIDDVYRSIAASNNMPYIELTDHFLALEDKTAYFFRFDGHPNKAGYEQIALYVGRQLIDRGFLK